MSRRVPLNASLVTMSSTSPALFTSFVAVLHLGNDFAKTLQALVNALMLFHPHMVKSCT